ncbi:Uu.00g091180.m01.CDS01 [Anthostomella pinea]|uniref:Uu.00g091180.m01.CDS01 n=1 Tax=Anthostomella pinea TaxID=933095 RepID=A0AAI8VNQ0_9PEZI|nr:Uu.00g091180.m01.CDS01 [Anthostomella pinea]
MSTSTRLQLPYCAPADQLPAPLPTFEEMLSARCITDDGVDAGVHNRIDRNWPLERGVIRVGEHFVAKLGTDVKTVEGENMLFVKNNTAIRVPAVYAIYERDNLNFRFRRGVKYQVIVMEYVPGETLSSKLDSLGKEEEDAIAVQLAYHFYELRGLAPPSYYGGLVDGQEARNYLFNSVTQLSRNNGQFMRNERLRLGYMEKWVLARAEFTRPSDEGDDAPVFTHGSLHAQNIVIQPDGTVCLIDWEDAGWCTAAHEYVIAMDLTLDWSRDPLWQEMLASFLDGFEGEMQILEDLKADRRRREVEYRAEY